MMKNVFIKANAPFLIAGALASLVLLTSEVFTVAPYVAFLAPIAALDIALPVILTLSVLSALLVAISYKAIIQNKKFNVKRMELNRLDRCVHLWIKRLGEEANQRGEELRGLVFEITMLLCQARDFVESDHEEFNIKKLEKEPGKAEQKLGDEKNKLALNIKESESKEVVPSLESKHKIEGSGTEVEGHIKQESKQDQEDDSGYCSGTSTPATPLYHHSLPFTSRESVRALGLFGENLEMKVDATQEDQSQKLKKITVEPAFLCGWPCSVSSGDSSSSEGGIGDSTEPIEISADFNLGKFYASTSVRSGNLSKSMSSNSRMS